MSFLISTLILAIFFTGFVALFAIKGFWHPLEEGMMRIGESLDALGDRLLDKDIKSIGILAGSALVLSAVLMLVTGG